MQDTDVKKPRETQPVSESPLGHAQLRAQRSQADTVWIKLSLQRREKRFRAMLSRFTVIVRIMPRGRQTGQITMVQSL